MDIQELAEYANSFFEQKTRSGGDEDDRFYAMKNYRPTWVREMAFAAHGDMTPDDYKYQYIVDTLDALSEGVNPDEPNFEPDPYNTNRTKWLASNLNRAYYVNDAVIEYGSEGTDILDDIGLGQIYEKRQVWEIVLNALQVQLDAIEAEEEETFEGKRPAGRRKRWSPKENQ